VVYKPDYPISISMSVNVCRLVNFEGKRSANQKMIT